MKIFPSSRIGLLLVNLGTPKSYHPKDVFTYLNEFLTDKRVIDMPWLSRQLLVRGIIIPRRYRQSASQYQKLWMKEGSPLLFYGRQVQEKLQLALGEEFKVALAMRYQEPSIASGLEELKHLYCNHIIILPLFPQYASATTGSVHQKVMEEISSWTIIPPLTFIHSYPDHPLMIEAFCEQAKPHLSHAFDHILFSFHGLPEQEIRKADSRGECLTGRCCSHFSIHNRSCYKAQCYATTKAIAEKLALLESEYTICFQSRLGSSPWIQPYIQDVFKECLKRGYKRLLVFCPSFVCDCLETTCEISHEYAKEFKQMGGEELQLVEGLNDHPLWIEALKQIIMSHSLNPKPKDSLALSNP